LLIFSLWWYWRWNEEEEVPRGRQEKGDLELLLEGIKLE
jgi:hypothetical protein